jgi:hypothetical protein
MAIGKEERAVWKMGVTCNKQKPNKKQVCHSSHITLWPADSKLQQVTVKIGNVS